LSLVRVTEVTADWDENEESPPFLIDGVVSSSMTLLYGRSKCGKSTMASALAVALANGDKQFLGKQVYDSDHKVGIVAGDPGGTGEFGRRIHHALRPGVTVPILAPERPARPEVWEAVRDYVDKLGVTFLIIDNLSNFIPPGGSLSDDQAVNTIYDHIEQFPRGDIPVLVVAHVSDRMTEHGPQRTPSGSFVIRARPRWWWHMWQRNDGTAVNEFDGNEGTQHTITVSEPVGRPSFAVLATDTDPARGRRDRAAATMQRREEIQRYVLADCQGESNTKTAGMLAEKFGGTIPSHKTSLSQGRYGTRRNTAGQWEVVTP
jgi:hypothetical protein